MRHNVILSAILLMFSLLATAAKDYTPEPYTWTTQSDNSSGSMPCGGHDIGMNVWVERGDLLVYLSRSGFFDEHNTLLKAGRLRLRLEPKDATGTSVFDGEDFRQTLSLDDGAVYVRGGGVTVRLWADVHEPKVFAEIKSAKPVKATLAYESWRHKDRPVPREAVQQFTWKWLSKGGHITYADSIRPGKSSIIFEHHNRKETVYDYTVSYEKLDAVKQNINNPIGDLSFGGRMSAPTFTYTGTTDGVYASTDYRAWNYVSPSLTRSTITVELAVNKGPLQLPGKSVTADASKRRSSQWWHAFWQRSYIKSAHPDAARIARNYELFRYMLGCNAYGQWPTKFNGGLFTFDPVYARADSPFTPDFRCWGGGTMTAQNQRLVYWPMLKSGDTDMMRSQFDTYLYMLPGAKARTQHYWGHGGACFEEQIENFGLPNPAEYGNHKPGQDPSWMKNSWLEYQYDTVLEFCQMILMANEYAGMDITPYRELITESVRFFDEHYQYLARQRGTKPLTEDGKLVVYPSSGCETYKMAYNPSSVIAALRAVVATLERHGGLAAWGLDSAFAQRIPDIPTRTIENLLCIAPAVTWMRINNVESPQLYPVFPWRIYGLGRPDIDVALNTYFKDDYVQKMRSSAGWKQDNIWAATLGVLPDAVRLCKEKFADGPYRFPAFWEIGFDWAPDHNRGGSAMIGLQEMLLQEKPDGELMLFPCWPKEWDAEFRLHATGGRTVDARIANGAVTATSTVTDGRGRTTTTVIPAPLRVTIFGDSYSTFEGYLTPSTNEPWYYWPGSPARTEGNDVCHPAQTWWWQVVRRLGARLETNNSYSGSTIGYTGYVIPETGKHDDYKPRSFITRLPDLGNPDLILICAGTNDSWDGEEIGEYKYEGWTEADLYTFRPAMAKFCSELKRLYPDKQVLFIINSELKPDFVESMKVIMERYGVEWLQLKNIDKQYGHPSVKGMRAFADQVCDYLQNMR